MNHTELSLLAGDAAVEWVWGDRFEDTMGDAPFVHNTVMREEVTRSLALRADATFVDATLGGGGHTEAILAVPGTKVIALDRDPTAILAAERRLAPFRGRFTAIHAPFSELGRVLEELGVGVIDGICADLGVSSPQLDDGARGLSFRKEGPLDMRMDPTSGETCKELIERLSDDELADVLFQYGDERRSRRISRSIKRSLDRGELSTTLDLRRAIVRAVGPVRVGGVDPATRSFQALRIAVNRELEELEALLAALPKVLAPGGRAALLTFHSLEDRLVKRAFKDKELFEPLTKKPETPTEEERQENPRSRSAKLRVAIRSPEAPP